MQVQTPGKTQIAVEPKYGNKMLYFEAAPETTNIPFRVTYKARRVEVQGLQQQDNREPTAAELQHFLTANRNVPIGGLSIPQVAQLAAMKKTNDVAVARKFYDHVDELVAYDKSDPGYGRGDVRWVCDSRTGNCTDFHSLFISLMREAAIPAKFEIGFPLPPQRGEGTIGGYHCWASFYAKSKGWVPVDISEADKHPEMKAYYFGNLTENRISFSTGRDIDLVPQQATQPLNYFVYPHAECNDKVIEKSHIALTIGYRDIADKPHAAGVSK